jgi:hypothetical protein
MSKAGLTGKLMHYNILRKKNKVNAYRAGRGFSTVEMLIAMSVLVISLSAIILVSFGTQSILVDSQTNSEAISKAQEFLEKEQSLARKDFKLVNPRATSTEDIYKIKVDVESQPDSDFLTKKVTATVSWPDQYNRGLNIKLSAFITNFENAVGGDTCDSVLSGNWANPDISNIFVGNTNSNASLSVDAYKKKLYAAISEANATDASTIFVYDLDNPKNPILKSSIDNGDTKAGINDIHATDGYLYVAKATGSASGQMQIFDISGWTPVQVGYDFKVDGATGIGKSIFYKDGYIYLGLTADSGPELHIIDVHSPSNPFEVGSYSVGSDINAIYVKGKNVYLATSNNKELVVLDISNPTSPVQADSFNDPGSGNGKSLYLVGDRLYLGKTADSGNPELYILNNPEHSPISASSSLGISSSVNGLLVRDYLTFLITNSQFQIWNTDNYLNIVPKYSYSLTGIGSSLDCEGNYLYAGSVDASNRAYLSVIYTP